MYGPHLQTHVIHFTLQCACVSGQKVVHPRHYLLKVQQWHGEVSWGSMLLWSHAAVVSRSLQLVQMIAALPHRNSLTLKMPDDISSSLLNNSQCTEPDLRSYWASALQLPFPNSTASPTR